MTRAAMQDPPPPAGTFGPLDAAGFTFLVVDDEEPVRRMVSSVLGSQAGRVFTAPDGLTALELLERHRPDVVISDIKMPGMDGIALLTHVRALAPETEFVLITGFADKDVVIEALRAGASSFLEKPFGVLSLLSLVQPSLDRVRLRRDNERLRAERERERKRQEEESRLAAMGRVLAGLAREILVPLGLAAQAVEMAGAAASRLEKGPSGEEALTWLGEAGECLSSIHDKVVTIERFLDPARPCRPVPLRVADALQRAAGPLASSRPEAVDVAVHVEEEAQVLCDAVDLETCFGRLVLNAYEAMAHKGSLLTISARRRANVVEVRLTDDGPGMPQSLVERALVPFFSTRPDAVGFGLPIAFEAARRNGGTLTVESQEGVGTTVLLTFPAAETMEQHCAA